MNEHPNNMSRRNFLRTMGMASAAGTAEIIAAASTESSAVARESTGSTGSTGSAETAKQRGSAAGAGKHDTVPEATETGTEFQKWADNASDRSVEFYGEHQAGVINPPPQYATVIGLDLEITGREHLQDLFKQLTDLARQFTDAGVARPLGIAAPPSDSGLHGGGWNSDELTITLGLGASLFDERFGLADKKPAKLKAMEPFDDDSLNPTQTDADVSLQICANNRDTVQHALREILRATRGTWALKWSKNGYRNPARPSGTPRNHFGFKDGTVNPDTTDAQRMESLVWADNGEPDWCKGGSYQVIRLIEMYAEFWDRITINEQEGIFGRDRVSGAPLTGGDEFTEPDYSNDARGSVIPRDAHIRLANPRTPETADQMILRRAFNWDDGLRPNGTLDLGLIFICYQQDLERQFITMQKRLSGEPLADYIRPVGGGYFFVPPGVKDENDYFGSGLFED